MMSHNSSSHQSFEVFRDSHSTDDETHDRECAEPTFPSQYQSRQLQHVDAPRLESRELNQICRNPNPIATQKSSKKARRIGGSRLTRPSLTYNTFEVLNTVSESDSEVHPGAAADSNTSDDAQRILELPAEEYSTHPLSVAARHIPPLDEQLSKHCDGFFEWILAVKVPNHSGSQRDTGSETDHSNGAKKLYFGCNLLPKSSYQSDDTSVTAFPANSFLLLVSPLKETNEVLEAFNGSVADDDMALSDINNSGASIEALCDGSSNGGEESLPGLTLATERDTDSLKLRIPLSPSEPVARIEDSFEALDQLEDQLEAFGSVAHLGKYAASEKPSSKQPQRRLEAPASHASVRFATPQPTRTCAFKLSSASVRIKPASEPRKPALRKANSMMLDSPKLKVEDKALAQSPKASTINHQGGASLTRQKSVGRLANPTNKPALEHNGSITEPSQERNDGKPTSQRAIQPTAASLRRAKSARLLTRPAFELPGETISRRKREEHQAQLKAQEEEERKRREFKARPPPSKVVPITAPRETIASRARQAKATMLENTARTPALTKYSAATIGPHSRSALLSTVNQQQVRGRSLKALKGESSPNQDSRATSASTNSVSGKRSSVTYEDVQMQKLRGHEIYKRDNSWTDNKARERQQRELLAKLAREEAAERSRQQSREWAARQARKRATISSLRDVIP